MPSASSPYFTRSSSSSPRPPSPPSAAGGQLRVLIRYSKRVVKPGETMFTPGVSGHLADHALRCLSRIQEFFSRGKLTDVTLLAGEAGEAEARRIPAHRLLLSAASDYFAAMFTSGLKESLQEEIRIVGVEAQALEDLVNYCYTGSLEITESNVECLLAAARLLQLTEVVGSCCGFLSANLHPSNALGIQQFADLQGCQDLFDRARSFVLDNFVDVMHSQEFLLLSPGDVAALFASDDLNVPSEEVVFQAFVAWVSHNPDQRRNQMQELLELVRLPLLCPEFLADQVDSLPLLREIPSCQNLVMEALKFHLLPDRRPVLRSQRTKPRKSTVGELFLVGGIEGNNGTLNIDSYDYREDRWVSSHCLSSRRLQFGVAVLENRLVIVGGRDGLKTLNTVEGYDPKAKIWFPMTHMNTHRHGLGVAVLGGPLYAVGGHDGWSYLNTVERYDPVSKTWSYVAPMYAARSTVGLGALNGKLYAVGGRDGTSCLSSVECYDPFTNRWASCSSMTRRRGGVAVAVLNGFIYAMGGHEAPGFQKPMDVRFETVERYDPKTDTWTLVASMSQARDAISACVLGEKVFAIGGYNDAYLPLVEAYDPDTDTWTKMTNLRSGRAGASAVVIPRDGPQECGSPLSATDEEQTTSQLSMSLQTSLSQSQLDVTTQKGGSTKLRSSSTSSTSSSATSSPHLISRTPNKADPPPPPTSTKPGTPPPPPPTSTKPGTPPPPSSGKLDTPPPPSSGKPGTPSPNPAKAGSPPPVPGTTGKSASPAPK
ncbi:unnamed protein product [Cyprideis torosa]|uniref:Uncharacterized protein n=1 Tax=Cyprideis torosa TaxID=163714 RepID=A0A7R8W7N3_9CRUS|nr:unnamed protein product [Cyprideis torosa]CAG0886548.1 unnamed protein product [Cyprideis torosa]